MQLELLDQEEKIIRQLKQNYRDALAEIKTKVRKMKESPSFQGKKAYQMKYQMMLEAQLQTILHKLGEQNVEDMTGYLDGVYREAYLGCLYGMHGDGVDLLLQVDETKVQKCINKDTKDLKFSQRLYENVDQLKDTVKAEIARGFSTGRDYASIARQISLKTGTSLARACIIARTEGHRVTSESEMDCMTTAKSKGADVVKEWISTLDSVTRATHVELDGQVRELDEEFVIPSSGARAMYPGGFGIAKEDIQCRCCMNQRARWNLDSEEYRYSRAAGEVVSIKSDSYREWKGKYSRYIADLGRKVSFPEAVLQIKGIDRAVKEELDKALGKLQNEYDIRLNGIYVEPAEERDIFVTGYHDGIMDMVVNQNADFIKIQSLLDIRYSRGYFAGKTFEDYIAHEMAHCMCYQDCRTDEEYYSRCREIELLMEQFCGMSIYGDRDWTGNDGIAEAFVKARRGEQLPENITNILEKYIGRWKR